MVSTFDWFALQFHQSSKTDVAIGDAVRLFRALVRSRALGILYSILIKCYLHLFHIILSHIFAILQTVRNNGNIFSSLQRSQYLLGCATSIWVNQTHRFHVYTFLEDNTGDVYILYLPPSIILE